MVATLDGDKKILRKLAHLKGAVARKIVRRAQSKAATPILKSAKRGVRVETKALKKSLGRKTTTYKNATVVTLIGPRTGHKDGETGRVPTRYAHLVERRYPYLRPAYDSNKASAEATMASEIKAGIEAEAKK